jgi:hypothetical protein
MNKSGVTTRPLSLLAPKADDGHFDLSIAVNGRNDWLDLE